MTRTALCVAVSLLASPLAAQELSFSFSDTQECLAAGGSFDTCVGAAADTCMQSSDGGSTTVGMGFCLEQEWQAWDARLNQHYADVRAAAKATDTEMRELGSSAPSQGDALREMQRAWITFRDAKCDYERSQWGGGTGGGPATLSCLMYETARQALYLQAANSQ